MALNKFMHPDNIYKQPPDFKQLALKYPKFLKHVTQDVAGKIHLDFKNPGSLRVLSETLLLHDFNLSVTIPEGSLIPTIPSRLNYLLWIKDLLKKCGDPQVQDVKGIDIGTGAAAVYCLLAVKHLSWKMLGTEVDADNYQHAVANVQRNHLQDSIQLMKVDETEILSSRITDDKLFDFSMCNPPFFTRESPGEAPGKDCEVKTKGGEVKFVEAMADQSLNCKDKVKVFSTMLGHKSSLPPVKQYLQKLGVQSLATTEFCQGRVMRWGIAWTFFQIDLSDVKSTKYKKGKEKPFTWMLPSKTGTSLNVFQTLKVWFTQIKVDVAVKKESKHFCSARLTSKHTLWRNQRKKKREQERANEQAEPKTSGNNGVCYGGKFSEQNDATDYMDSGAESCLLQELLNKDSSSCLNSAELSVNGRLGEPTNQKSTGDEPANEKLASDNSANKVEKSTRVNPEIRKGVPENSTQSREEEECQLECNFSIRLSGQVIQLDLVYLGGQAGRDGVHQLLQYLKNQFAKK